ncbi:MAG TPA: LysR family transcriptional regulator [Candidatus Acidoferrum sp.]|nr:LysR family transcriptional regulator [Candidatus Acidoferrum sp.]
MNIDDLRCFLTVAELKNYRRAAETLFISQSALSRKIFAVERELGILLLNRTTRSVTLTQAGAACLEDVRRIVADYDALKGKAVDTRLGAAGTLNIGYYGWVGIPHVITICDEIAKNYPLIKVKVFHKAMPDVCESLMRGEADIIVTMRTIAEKLAGTAFVVFCRQSPSVAVSVKHPLAARESVPVEMLRDEPIIMHTRERSPALHDALEELCIAAGFRPNVVTRLDESGVIHAALGHGILLMPTNAGQDYNFPDHVKCLPLTGRHPQFDIVAVWRENCVNPAVLLAIELFDEIIGDGRRHRPP